MPAHLAPYEGFLAADRWLLETGGSYHRNLANPRTETILQAPKGLD